MKQIQIKPKKVMRVGETIELVCHNITHLLAENDNIVRLLASSSPECLSLDVTEEMRDEIFDEGDRAKSRVFQTPFVPKTETKSCAQLRVYASQVNPLTEFTADVYIVIDIIVDVEVNALLKGQRWFRLMSEIIDTISGKDVGGISRLQLYKSVISLINYKDNFFGYCLPFQVKVGAD